MTDLTGKRILVTRPKSQAAAFIEKLANLGAVPVLFPTIEIVNQQDNPLLDQAINQLNSYHWVIFTSVNGVSAFWQRLSAQGRGKEIFDGVQVAAIGPATAQALTEAGVQPNFTPDEYVAEAILPGLGKVEGQRILLPRADIARKALVEALKLQGAFPEEIAVYQTLPAPLDPQALAELEKGIDIATFTSSSTVRNFFGLLEHRALEVLDGALIACIGPITANTAREFGLRVDLTAETYTIDGLVEALLGYESPN
jgi:uroporphyrinogen-III synthase